MGNAFSNSALSAVAKSVNLTKPQIMEIRHSCADMASANNRIRRKLFQLAVAKAGVQEEPDAEILDFLFTMWDVNGESRVPYLEFVASFATLACRYENLASAMYFLLKVMDLKDTGKVTSAELIVMLQSTSLDVPGLALSGLSLLHLDPHTPFSCPSLALSGISQTASYFGDSLMTENQIYKLSDSVFDNITMINADDQDAISHRGTAQSYRVFLSEVYSATRTAYSHSLLTHLFLKSRTECVNILMQEPLVHKIMSKQRKRPAKVTFASADPKEDTFIAHPKGDTFVARFDGDSLISSDISSVHLNRVAVVTTYVEPYTSDPYNPVVHQPSSDRKPQIELRGY
jgi:Ca2+-binding EF-hand superfamily protein